MGGGGERAACDGLPRRGLLRAAGFEAIAGIGGEWHPDRKLGGQGDGTEG